MNFATLGSIAIVLSVVLLLQSAPSPAQDRTSLPYPGEGLPFPQAHPLPEGLAQWQSAEPTDYFDQVSPSSVGYLIWSELPIKVFVESAVANPQARIWTESVAQAIREWSAYLPLELVDIPEAADVVVWRRSPPLRMSNNLSPSILAEPPSVPVLRARSAETRYELFIDRTSAPATLSHRCQIWLRPSQTATYIQAAARHELGHALGIWGHSPQPNDALYFSQVRNPPALSPRDINTLKQIYQQPTRLGWSVEPS